MGKLGWVLMAAMAVFATAVGAAETERQAPWWCYYDEGGNAISGTIPHIPKKPFDPCWLAENRNPGQIRPKLENALWAEERVTGLTRMFFPGNGGDGERLYFHLNRTWTKHQYNDPVNPRGWEHVHYQITGGWAAIILNTRNNAERIDVKIYHAGWTTVPVTSTGETTWRAPRAAYTWEVIVTSPTGCIRPATSPALSSTVATTASAAMTAIEAALDDVRACFP